MTATNQFKPIEVDPLPQLPAIRSPWVDQLRMVMILLVVNMHACVTYSHVGSWYYNSDAEPPIASKLLFAMWQGHLQSFFMGLLFFLAGFYAQKSKAKKGPAEFSRERLLRLGLPTLLFVLLIHPLTIFLLQLAGEDSGFTYRNYIASGGFLSGTGPLWFAEALLIFCLVYALVPERQSKPEAIRINKWALPAFATLVAVCTFLIRVYQPIGTNVLNLQFCFFSQYVAAFAAGIWIARHKLLESLASSRLSAHLGWAGLILGPIVMIATYTVGGPVKDHALNPYFGGPNFQSLLVCFWEQFAGLGLALGALTLAYRKFNHPGKFGQWLADRSFAVYVLHTPVLVGAALLLRPLNQPPLTMAAVLTVVGLVGTFFLAEGFRRLATAFRPRKVRELITT